MEQEVVLFFIGVLVGALFGATVALMWSRDEAKYLAHRDKKGD